MIEMTLEQLKCLQELADVANATIVAAGLLPEFCDDAEKRARLLDEALRDVATNLLALHEKLGGDL